MENLHEKLATAELSKYLSSAEELIEEARNGRMFILVDDEDRENEGDLVVPAQFATPDAINFMARHARGLICLALTQHRVEKLGLPLMSQQNGTRHQTAFTVSIEAREGVTTGISAADRAKTVAVAINPDTTRDDITTPGHVFPLLAREGGTLVRAGHTEASVDIARKAGLNPAAVICEIMNDDGTMARLPDLIAFAQLHGMKIGAIADLIAYRRRTERQVDRVLERPFDSTYGGHFRMYIYRHTIDGTEHVVLVKGRIDPDKPTLVRMPADMLGQVEARRDYVPAAMRAISAHDGAGVAVFLRDPNPAWLSERYSEGPIGASPEHALRDYGVGAQILLDLGVRDMILLTTRAVRPAALDGYSLKIVGWRPVTGEA
jgi:3,4-dihydroxy 2-butanone 4-phosphate synthase/GTP cyclohydrolase II